MLTQPIAVTTLVTGALETLGVMKVQGERLDRDYLRPVATTLGVSDLLEQALDQVVVTA